MIKYNVYCLKTQKLLAVYNNKETLKTMDTSKCFYIPIDVVDVAKRMNVNLEHYYDRNSNEASLSNHDAVSNVINRNNNLVIGMLTLF